jgi:hypothetical protein
MGDETLADEWRQVLANGADSDTHGGRQLAGGGLTALLERRENRLPAGRQIGQHQPVIGPDRLGR